MNKLIFLATIIPILLVPNTYASSDNPTRLSDEDFNAAIACGNQGYDNGQNGDFDQGKNEECEELNRKTGSNIGMESTYYLSFIDGCIDADNTKDVCETFTDE